MSVTIENLTNHPVILTLTSGQTLRLAPAATSPTLPEVEVKLNAKLEQLAESRVIRVQTLAQGDAGAASGAGTGESEKAETSSTQKAKKTK